MSEITIGGVLSAGLRAEFLDVYTAKVKALRHCPYCRMNRPQHIGNRKWDEHQWSCFEGKRGIKLDYGWLESPYPVRWARVP